MYMYTRMRPGIFCMFVQEKEMKGHKHKQHRKQRALDRWGHYREFDTMAVEGAFDPNPICSKSICKYDRNKGVLSINSYFDTGTSEWIDEPRVQRELNGMLRRLVKAKRYGSLCVCTNGTRQIAGRRKGELLKRFVNVEYYARCDRPEPTTVCEMAKTIRGVLDNECVQLQKV